MDEHWVILFSEICPKLPVILREMLEGDQILGDFGMSWSEFWAKLEEIESSMAYWDRLLLHKNLGGGKSPSSDLKVPKGKEKAGTTQKGAGERHGGWGFFFFFFKEEEGLEVLYALQGSFSQDGGLQTSQSFQGSTCGWEAPMNLF